MSGGDGGHDGETQPAPSVIAAARRISRDRRVRRCANSATLAEVLAPDPGRPRGARRGPPPRTATSTGVPPGVSTRDFSQARRHLAQPHLVAQDRHRARGLDPDERSGAAARAS